MLEIDYPTAKAAASSTKEIVDVLCKVRNLKKNFLFTGSIPTRAQKTITICFTKDFSDPSGNLTTRCKTFAPNPTTKKLQKFQLALGNDAAIRDAAMRSLAAFMRAVTKKSAEPLLTSVAADKLKMAKVEEYYDQFIVDHPFDDGKKKVEPSAATKAPPSQAKQNKTAREGPSAADMRL